MGIYVLYNNTLMDFYTMCDKGGGREGGREVLLLDIDINKLII